MKIIFSILLIFSSFVLFQCVRKDVPPKLAVVGVSGGDTITVDVGSNFTATFMVTHAVNAYAVAALVNYDTTHLTLVKDSTGRLARGGTFLGTSGDLTAVLVNNIPGKILFAYSKQGEQPGTSGDGELWSVSLLAIKAGLTKIAFDRSRCFIVSPNLVGNELEKLPSKFDDKLIRIAETQVPADTATVYIRVMP
jgi:hypothetical protein